MTVSAINYAAFPYYDVSRIEGLAKLLLLECYTSVLRHRSTSCSARAYTEKEGKNYMTDGYNVDGNPIKSMTASFVSQAWQSNTCVNAVRHFVIIYSVATQKLY